MASVLAAAAEREPDAPDLRLHLGLLGLLRSDGVDAAYALLADRAARRSALIVVGPDPVPSERLLALARVDSGLHADDPEAHFRLATIALLHGSREEAAAALTGCAEHAAPYEKADFRRRLLRFATDYPGSDPTITELIQVLS